MRKLAGGMIKLSLGLTLGAAAAQGQPTTACKIDTPKPVVVACKLPSR